ncbi:MAG: PAS domain S-box protein, partial [Cyanobacteria bacterium P01_H01_bin.15]
MNSSTSSHNTPPLNSVLALEFSGTWLAQQTAVVESIASDRALSESLTRIAQLAESLLVHARVTIHLYDSETGLLTTGAAPSMPDSYRQKVNNIELTDKMGSCGPAIFSGKPAVCRDTNSDPRWEVFKDTIKEYDIRASWSIPCISSRNKEALGTLCIYWDESRTPREQELEMMVNVTQLFRIAVERHRTKILQQRQLALIEAAVEGIAFLEDDCFVYLNSAYVKMFGYETYRQLKGRSWDCCLDPSRIQHFQHHVLTKLMETNAWQGQTTAKRCDGSLFAMDISLTRIPESNCWVLVCRDVSDRERTEQELRDSRQLLRQIIDHLPQFIGWKDQN